jgi:hypothetical protein
VTSAVGLIAGLVVAAALATPASATNPPWLGAWVDASAQLAPQPHASVAPGSTLGQQQSADLVAAPDAGVVASPVRGNPVVRMIGDGSTVEVADLLVGQVGQGSSGWSALNLPGDPTYDWKIRSNGSQPMYDTPCSSGPCVAPGVAAELTAVGSTPGALVIARGGDDASGVNPDGSAFDAGNWNGVSRAWVKNMLTGLLNQTSSESCRVWVNLPETYGSIQQPDYVHGQNKQNFALNFNAQLQYLAPLQASTVVVARWNDLVSAHPEYLDHDGVHPSRVGAAARADLIRSALQQCPAATGVARSVPLAPREVRLQGTAGTNVLVSWLAPATGPAPTGYRVALPPGSTCPTAQGWVVGPFECTKDVSAPATSLPVPESAFPANTAISGIAVAAIGADGLSAAVGGNDAKPAPDAPDNLVHRDGGISAQLRDGRSVWFFSDPGENGWIVAMNNMSISEPGSMMVRDRTHPSAPLNHPPLDLVSRADAAAACGSDTIDHIWITSASVSPVDNANVTPAVRKDRITFFFRTRCTHEAGKIEHVGVGTIDYDLTQPLDPNPQTPWQAWSALNLNANLFPNLNQLFYAGTDTTVLQTAQITGQTSFFGADGYTYLVTCGSLTATPTSTSQCYEARVVAANNAVNPAGYSFWNGSNWVTDVHGEAAMTMGATVSPTEVSIRYVGAQNAYVMANRASMFDPPTVHLRTSTRPQGPWTDMPVEPTFNQAAGDCSPYAVPATPPYTLDLCYLTQIHPEWSSSRYLAVSTYDMIRLQDHLSLLPITSTPPVMDRYTALPPARFLDTATSLGLGTRPPGPVGAGQTVQAQLNTSWGKTGAPGVPVAATAVTVEITIVNPSADTSVTIFPTGDAAFDALTVDASAGSGTTTALTTVKVGLFGTVMMRNASGNANITLDVVGWWGPTAASTLVPATIPTRTTTAVATGGTPTAVQIAGTNGVPANATAVLATLTATTPPASGTVTAWGAGAAPSVPALTFPTGETRANTILVPLDATGKVNLTASVAGVSATLDVTGWTVNATGSTATGVRHLSAHRVHDSRWVLGPLGPGTTRKVLIAGNASVPTDATSVLVRVTAIAPTGATALTVWPSGQPQPATSNVSGATGLRANLALVPIGADGTISVANLAGTSGVAIDVEGFILS